MPSGLPMGISLHHIDFLSVNGARAWPWQITDVRSLIYVQDFPERYTCLCGPKSLFTLYQIIK